MTQSPLLEPIDFGPYRLPNRVVMSPMTRNRSPGELPNALNAAYYAQRATAGLIISESTAISAEGLGGPRPPASSRTRSRQDGSASRKACIAMAGTCSFNSGTADAIRIR
jgi:2,4-dienoyl-CoA reductase-like NADH-dependent reductase (Old Yellow Enzyme family)